MHTMIPPGACKLLAMLALLSSVMLVPSAVLAQTPYEAEASGNTLSGQTKIASCSGCSGHTKVSSVGNGSGNSLTVNGVQAVSNTSAIVTVFYLVRGTLTLFVDVNGDASTSYTVTGKSWQTPSSFSFNARLNQGSNTIRFYNDSAAAPDIDRIVVVGAEGSFGLLTNGQRNKFQWPFSSDSIWNTAIGSEAKYQAAGIVSNVVNGSPTVFSEDEDVMVMAPTAPNTNVYFNGIGWNGGDRCKVQGGVVATVPLPSFYVLGNSGNNNSAAFLASDARTVEQNQPFTRCVANGKPTTLVAFANADIYGQGLYGAHGGSGLSALGGTIRLGEFSSGSIHHSMKIELWAAQYYYCCKFHWPANTIDGYANHKTYGGKNPHLTPGSLLALPPSYDVSQMKTTPGKILAQAFKDYGAYVVDDTFWNAWGIATEQGPNGRVVDEFATLYGFRMDNPAQSDPFMRDIINIVQALQIITNNSPKSIGGGGTPRVPSPPAIGN